MQQTPSNRENSILNLKTVYSEWVKENSKRKDKELASQYDFSTLSDKVFLNLIKEKLRNLISEAEAINCDIFSIWKNTNFTNTLFDNPGTFKLAEVEFLRKIDISDEIEQLPEDEQYLRLIDSDEELDAFIADYHKKFIRFIEIYYEYCYICELIPQSQNTNDSDEILDSSDPMVRIHTTSVRDELLTRTEAAEYLKIGKSTISKYSSLKFQKEHGYSLKSTRVGGNTRYKRSDLDDFCKQHPSMSKTK